MLVWQEVMEDPAELVPTGQSFSKEQTNSSWAFEVCRTGTSANTPLIHPCAPQRAYQTMGPSEEALVCFQLAPLRSGRSRSCRLEWPGKEPSPLFCLPWLTHFAPIMESQGFLVDVGLVLTVGLGRQSP